MQKETVERENNKYYIVWKEEKGKSLLLNKSFARDEIRPLEWKGEK